MKFLLTAINAKFIHSNPAIYSLRAGAGEKLQPYVELAEFTINESLESILEGIWKRQPKVIGFYIQRSVRVVEPLVPAVLLPSSSNL